MTDIIHSINKSNPDTPLRKKRGWRDGSAVRMLAVFPEALSPPQGRLDCWLAGQPHIPNVFAMAPGMSLG